MYNFDKVIDRSGQRQPEAWRPVASLGGEIDLLPLWGS